MWVRESNIKATEYLLLKNYSGFKNRFLKNAKNVKHRKDDLF